MKNWRVFLLAVAAAVFALVISPAITRADDLTGSVGISWISGGSTFASDTIAVGSTLSCPGASPICAGYFGLGSEAFGVSNPTPPTSLDPSISYSISDYTGIGNPTYGTPTDFDFTGLTFASGEPLSGFTITNNTIGLTDADVTMGPSSIFVDLTGLNVDGTFTINLIPETPVAAPEPSSFLLLGLGLIALAGLARKRFESDRFGVESAS
jgi:hypothetical protein